MNGATELLGPEYESYLLEVLPEAQPPASMMVEIWVGALEILMSYPDMLDEIRPPESLSSEHDGYRVAVRDLFADMLEKMRDFETVEEFEGYFLTENVFSAPKLRINDPETFMSLQAACLALESGLANAGVDGAFIVACP